MSATEQKDEAEPEFESCPEIDEDFFRKMEESGAYMTVDSWEDDNKDVKVEVKEEPKDSSRGKRSTSKDSKSRSRTESERSRDRDRGRDREKERTSHDRDRDRRRRSPDPPKRSRFSPPGRRRSRSRSPPARRYPPSRPAARPPHPTNRRPTFLDEMTAKFPELQNGQQQNFMMNQQPNAFGMPQQMHPQMVLNPMANQMHPNFMPGRGNMPGQPFMQPQQHFNQNGPIPPLMSQFQTPLQQPFHNNIVPVPVVNPLNNPLIAPGTYVEPQPVAPPRAIPAPLRGPVPSSLTSRTELRNEVIACRRKEEEIQQTTKKDLENLPLIDMLKKISEAKARESFEATKVERVKEAISLLNEPATNERRLPFTFNLSNKDIAPVRSDPKMKLRSPLVISDNNPVFVSQAREEDCRDAMLGNPLRNITGELFDFARHLGLDLVDISEKVKAAAEPVIAKPVEVPPRAVPQMQPQAMPQMQPQAMPKMQIPSNAQLKAQAKAQMTQAKSREFPADISNKFIDLTGRRAHQSVQTMFNPCDECEARSRKKFSSKGAQCEMAVPASEQKADEPGSFKASFDAAKMKTFSETQRQAIAKFCQAFNLYPDTFGSVTEPVGRLVKAEKRAPPAVLEDLAAYTNPENPNQSEFVSFSPVRVARESPKVSPFNFNPSPYGSGRNPSPAVDRSPIRQQFDDSPLVPRRSSSFSPPSQNSRNGRLPGYGLNDYEGRSYDRSPHLSRSRSPQGGFLRARRSPSSPRMRSRSPRGMRSRSPRGMRSQSPRAGYQGRYPYDSSPRRRPISERLGSKVPSPMGDYIDTRSPNLYLDQGPSNHYRDQGGPSHFTETRPYLIPSPSRRDYRDGNSYERDDVPRGRDRPISRSPSPRRRSPAYRQPPTSRRGRF